MDGWMYGFQEFNGVLWHQKPMTFIGKICTVLNSAASTSSPKIVLDAEAEELLTMLSKMLQVHRSQRLLTVIIVRKAARLD